jgi:eukaryotic-like serine/threonine-protein kinase
MGEVFRATVMGAEGFERPVAIKRMWPAISSDARFAAMFVNEARISALLQHANIVQVLDFDRDEDGRLFLVMELVDGVDLATLMRRGPVPVPIAAIHCHRRCRRLGYGRIRPIQGGKVADL